MKDDRCSAGAEKSDCVTLETVGADSIVQHGADGGPNEKRTASRGDTEDSNETVADGDNTGAVGGKSGVGRGENGRTIADGGSGVF